jgi:CRP-like cAMP-binding protein
MVEKTLLQQVKLFGDLKDYEWEVLSKITKKKEYVEGDIIFAEGDASTEVYMVLKGEISIQIKLAPQLGESTVFVARPFDVIGEFAFVDAKIRSATARCTKKAIVGVIGKTDFEDIVKRFPAVGLNFYRSLVCLLSERLRRMNATLRETYLRFAGLEM